MRTRFKGKHFQPLYKKHRPKSFDGLIGNKSTINKLKAMITRQGTMNRVLLFHGPPGCGKTTLARIMKKELGIEDQEYREINAAVFGEKEHMKNVTRRGGFISYKLTVLDEAHGLTAKGQSVLLKPLEEEDTRVYILITNEPNKLSEPIKGRCDKFELAPLKPQEIGELIDRIAGKERIELSDKKRRYIIGKADGNPRDAIIELASVGWLNDEELAEVTEEQKIILFPDALKTSVGPFSDFKKEDYPKRETIMEPWLLEATLALLAGPSGKGKSWFAMEIAGAVAEGRAGFGIWNVPKPAKVLYMDGEMHYRELIERGELLQWDRVDIFSKTALELTGVNVPINLKEAKIRKPLTEFILDEGYKLVILDNLTSLVWGVSFTTDVGWSDLNQWLLTLRANNVSVIVVHHTGKTGTSQLGTSTRINQLDYYFLLESEDETSDTPFFKIICVRLTDKE